MSPAPPEDFAPCASRLCWWAGLWVVAGLAGAAIILCLATLEPQGRESWTVWLFARIFSETGEFLHPSRSPLYAVYASLFLPLGYPWGPFLARLPEAAIVFLGLFSFARIYGGTLVGGVFALVSMPSILALNPPAIGLATSCFVWGLALRHDQTNRARRVWSYALLMGAALFRPNFLLAPLLMAAYDLIGRIRDAGFMPMLVQLRPRLRDWPIVLAVALTILFSFNQSSHRWNNGNFTDITWFGTTSPSAFVHAQLGALTQWVIISKHNNDYDNHDIYFVTKEEFGEVHSFPDILKRGDLLLGNAWNNRQLLHYVALMTDLGSLMHRGAVLLGDHRLSYPIFFLALLAGVICFCLREWRQEHSLHATESMVVIGLISAPLIFSTPTWRYLTHIGPVFLFAGLWYGRIFHRLISRWVSHPAARAVALSIPVIAFSSGLTRWSTVAAEASTPAFWLHPHGLKEYLGGLSSITRHVSSCRGIMAIEVAFIGAFSSIPVNHLYAIYEIPPFGRLDSGDYDGLRPDRIDCLVINTHEVRRGQATFTTRWSRYENYIVPYARRLEAMGARRIHLPPDIELVVLKPIEEKQMSGTFDRIVASTFVPRHTSEEHAP